MKPDYKNWMPKGMILSFAAGAIASLLLCLLFARVGWVSGTRKTVLTVLFPVLAAIFFGLTIWSVFMYRAFDYTGKRQVRVYRGLSGRDSRRALGVLSDLCSGLPDHHLLSELLAVQRHVFCDLH